MKNTKILTKQSLKEQLQICKTVMEVCSDIIKACLFVSAPVLFVGRSIFTSKNTLTVLQQNSLVVILCSLITIVVLAYIILRCYKQNHFRIELTLEEFEAQISEVRNKGSG